jgi:dCTP diphosphatase
MTDAAIRELTEALRLFAKERDWDQFHSPKNLAMALSVEAAELLEQFQWLTEAESQAPSAEQRKAIGEEMADVFLFLLRLADKLDIDLIQESGLKLELNAMKYPVEKARGKSTKYTKL